MKTDFYKDPTKIHGEDWRVISVRLWGDLTLENVTVEGRGQWEYILQSKIEGGWVSEYFSCMNGERLHEGKFAWQIEEEERNAKKVVDMPVSKCDSSDLSGIPDIDPLLKMVIEEKYPKHHKLLTDWGHNNG